MWPLAKPKPRHLISLLVFMLVFVALFYFLTITSPSYEVAKYELQNNKEIKKVTGLQSSTKIHFLKEMDLRAELSHMYFKIKGSKGNFNARVFLRENKNSWYVCKIMLYKKDALLHNTVNTCDVHEGM